MTRPRSSSRSPATTPSRPGETTTGTATHTITQADLDAGSLTNTASAQGAFAGAPVTSTTDSVTATATQGPALSLDKTAAPLTYDSVGDVITYTYTLTNTGNVTLTAPLRSATTAWSWTLPACRRFSSPARPPRWMRPTPSPRPTSTPGR